MAVFSENYIRKDVVGIGFGPSNLASAIAFREMAPQLDVSFLEARPKFAWHPGMLFDEAMMQVSFLKDMASFRNPRSEFTFVNYLHAKHRLADFANLSTFYPTRIEFADYLSWCAAEFSGVVNYGYEVTAIEPVYGPGGRVDRLRISATGPSGPVVIESAAVLHAGGLESVMPQGVTAGARIFHSYEMIPRIDSIAPPPGAHYFVAGSGQSAAEIIGLLHARDPTATITSVISRFGFTPADSSPFVNQIFDAQSVDLLYSLTQDDRDLILQAHRGTNYAAVDLDLIRELYRLIYNDKLQGRERIRLKRLSYVTGATEGSDEVAINLRSMETGAVESQRADYLICATGFQPRSIIPLLSDDLRRSIAIRSDGQPHFGRAYDLRFNDAVAAKIYSVGMCEQTHGLSATLISNMAVRAGEIAVDICTAHHESNTPVSSDAV